MVLFKLKGVVWALCGRPSFIGLIIVKNAEADLLELMFIVEKSLV
jgi:hypothetical protein